MATFWRDTDHSSVTIQEAIGEWSLAAWDVLEDVAKRYRRTISSEALAVQVQKRTGILTSLPSVQWVGPLVSLVAQRAHEARGAQLAALVSDDGRTPHPTWDAALALEGKGELDTVEVRRAWLDARTTAHRVYGATMPAGADLAAESEPRRVGRPRKVVAPVPEPEVRKPAVCPTCWIQLPGNGRCDTCD